MSRKEVFHKEILQVCQNTSDTVCMVPRVPWNNVYTGCSYEFWTKAQRRYQQKYPNKRKPAPKYYLNFK